MREIILLMAIILVSVTLVLFASLVNTGCTTTQITPRDNCVAQAMLKYQEQVMQCKEENLNYQQCDERYWLESEFKRAQKKCEL